jgi:hypothetical protein
MECRLAGETEVLGENLPQRHFCPSQNPTWPDLGLNPGRRGGNAKLVPKEFRVALHASHVALSLVTSKFRPNVALPMLVQISS